MKRILLIIFVMSIILAMGSNIASAINLKLTSLTIIIKYGREPLRGINTAICRVASAATDNGLITYNAVQEFAGAGAVFSDLTKEKNIALAASLNAYVNANNIGQTLKKTNNSGAVNFNDLSAGLYLVTQVSAESNQYIIAPFLVSVPGFNESKNELEYEVTAYPKTEPVKKSPEPSRNRPIIVYKVWAGTNDIPSSIQVQLYRNDVPYGIFVTLNAGNNWSHTWQNMNPDYSWTVDEFNVPDGYIKTISGSVATGFIITNTKKDKPSSGRPDRPSPGRPDTTRPGGNVIIDDDPPSGNSIVPDTNQPNDNTIVDIPSPGYPGNPGSPKTSDESNMQFWITLIVFSAVGLLTSIFVIFFVQWRRKYIKK